MVATPPPSKKEQLYKLLERGSVFVHLDPRREGVVVPAWLTKKPQLVLQLGLNFPIPIRDLEIDDAGVRCTLSFNRAPFYCVLPWTAVYALVAEDGQVTVWPSELPTELVPQSEPAVRRDGPREKRPKAAPRPRIAVVPAAAMSDAGDDASEATSDAAEAPSKGAEDAAASAPAEPVRLESARATEPTPEARPTPATRPARERPPYLRLVK